MKCSVIHGDMKCPEPPTPLFSVKIPTCKILCSSHTLTKPPPPQQPMDDGVLKKLFYC